MSLVNAMASDRNDEHLVSLSGRCLFSIAGEGSYKKHVLYPKLAVEKMLAHCVGVLLVYKEMRCL